MLYEAVTKLQFPSGTPYEAYPTANQNSRTKRHHHTCIKSTAIVIPTKKLEAKFEAPAK
jgi:hypothetical protein